MGKRVPTVSGDTILLGSSKAGEKKERKNAKEEFMKKQEERSRRRLWKFQGDREEERHIDMPKKSLWRNGRKGVR